MGASDLENALETFSALVKSHPGFTEALNKRATVYFLLGRYQESLADCALVLERSRRSHFGALSGSGLVHLELWEQAQARAREMQPPGESVVANHHRRIEHDTSSRRHLQAAHAVLNEAARVHPHMQSARSHLRRIENLLGQGKP